MERMLRYLKEELKGFLPNRVLDIGAWNGAWTRMVKQIWSNAHYTCIEAGAKHKQKLEECADEVHIAVLGDRPQKVNMHLRKIKEGTKITYTKGSTLFSDVPAFDNKDPRDMVTLESLVGHDASYDFIKQDVEGAEMLIMKGSSQIFKRAKYVLQEVSLPDVNDMDAYMKNLGFLKSKIIEDHRESNPGSMTDKVDKIYWK